MITGASSGIGRGLAVELAARGAKVGLIARRREMLNQLVEEIQRDGGFALAVAASGEDPDGMGAAASSRENEVGPIDVMVANAGIGTTTDGANLEAAAVARIFSVNVVGAAGSVAAVVPKMLERGRGHLVAIS